MSIIPFHCREGLKWEYDNDYTMIFRIAAHIEILYLNISHNTSGSNEFASIFKDENNVLYDDRLSKITRVELRFSGKYWKVLLGKDKLDTFFKALARMKSIDTVGFPNLSNVDEELLGDVLAGLSALPKLSTVYIENYRALYVGQTDVIQFLVNLPNVVHVFLIDSRIDCIIVDKARIKTLYIENSHTKSDEIRRAEYVISSVLLQNADTLQKLQVYSKNFNDFLDYILLATYHGIGVNLDEMWVQYNINDDNEPLMIYEMAEKKQRNEQSDNVLDNINLTVKTIITTELPSLIRKIINGEMGEYEFMKTNIIRHLVIYAYNGLTAEDFDLLKSLILNKQNKLQRLEIKTDNLETLQEIWQKACVEITHVVEFSLAVDKFDTDNIASGNTSMSCIHTDNISRETNNSDLIFTLAVYTNHVYEIFAREEKHLRLLLWATIESIVNEYADWLSMELMAESLETDGPSRVLQITLEKIREYRKLQHPLKTRSLAKLKKITANIELKDRDIIMTLFDEFDSLRNTIFILKTKKEAEAVQQWGVDETKWNRGIIEVYKDTRFSIEFTSTKAEVEELGDYPVNQNHTSQEIPIIRITNA